MFKKAGQYAFYAAGVASAMASSVAVGAKIEEHREEEFRAAHPGKEIETGSRYIGGIGFCNTYEVKKPVNPIDTQQPKHKM